MTNHVFEGEHSFAVHDRNRTIDFEVNADYSLTVDVNEEAGWDSQHISSTLTEQEAKQLLAFLVAKGY